MVLSIASISALTVHQLLVRLFKLEMEVIATCSYGQAALSHLAAASLEPQNGQSRPPVSKATIKCLGKKKAVNYPSLGVQNKMNPRS